MMIDSDAVLDSAALASLAEVTGGDSIFFAELIDTYVEDSSQLLVAMRDAVAPGDAEDLRRAAHSLKGNSATLGATALAALCQELEELGKSGVLNDAAGELARAEAACHQVEVALRGVRPEV